MKKIWLYTSSFFSAIFGIGGPSCIIDDTENRSSISTNGPISYKKLRKMVIEVNNYFHKHKTFSILTRNCNIFARHMAKFAGKNFKDVFDMHDTIFPGTAANNIAEAMNKKDSDLDRFKAGTHGINTSSNYKTMISLNENKFSLNFSSEEFNRETLTNCHFEHSNWDDMESRLLEITLREISSNIKELEETINKVSLFNRILHVDDTLKLCEKIENKSRQAIKCTGSNIFLNTYLLEIITRFSSLRNRLLNPDGTIESFGLYKGTMDPEEKK